jgi:replication-associated recombination protein RarA
MNPAVSSFALGDPAELEIEVDRVIADCDGDQRAALRALVVANAMLEAEVEQQRRELAEITAELSRADDRDRFYSRLRCSEQPIPYTPDS